MACKQEPLTKAEILRCIQFIGQELAWHADPINYSHERRDQAKQYFAPLGYCRGMWKRVFMDFPPLDALRDGKRWITGIEGNFLGLLISAVQGDQECIRRMREDYMPQVRDKKTKWE